MKSLYLLIAFLFFINSPSFILASNPSPTTGKNSNLKPMTPPHPLAQQINKRLRTQLKLIQKGLRTGKLTKEQAISLRESIKSTRQQMLAFLKQNGNFELTTDQQKQLNRGLDSNSSTIDERPAIINR